MSNLLKVVYMDVFPACNAILEVQTFLVGMQFVIAHAYLSAARYGNGDFVIVQCNDIEYDNFIFAFRQGGNGTEGVQMLSLIPHVSEVNATQKNYCFYVMKPYKTQKSRAGQYDLLGFPDKRYSYFQR